MRSTARWAALGLTAAVVVPLAAAPALAAAGDPLTGYWSRTRTGAPLPIEPPDPVPPGGTWVSGNPAGDVAVSALRVQVVEGRVAVELRLPIADAIGPVAVEACPSDDQWAPVQGGRLEGAPAADCEEPIEAAVDGEDLVVPLAGNPTAVNVLLRPKPGAAFSLTMERATDESVVTAPDAATQAGPPSLAPPPFFSGGFTPAGPAFAPPPPFTGPLLPAVDPVPAEPQPVPQAAPAPVAAPLNQVARPVLPAEDRVPSLVAAGLLVLLLAQAVRLARQPAAAPRALGGVARLSGRANAPAVATAARGVGRFRSERDRKAVPL